LKNQNISSLKGILSKVIFKDKANTPEETKRIQSFLLTLKRLSKINRMIKMAKQSQFVPIPIRY
jgi:hypothetical protein